MRRGSLFALGLAIVGAAFFFVEPVYAAVQCANGAQKLKLEAAILNAGNNPDVIDTAKWTCQIIDQIDPHQGSYCAESISCAANPKEMCCPPIVGQAILQKQQKNEQDKYKSSLVGNFVPATCLADGECSLDDVIKTGAKFVKFLFGISGAILLGIFVYAGWLYLFAAVDPSGIEKSKKMMTGSVIGILIMFGAHTIVRFFVEAFLLK